MALGFTPPSSGSYDEKARIYAVANPVVLAQQSAALQRGVFQALAIQQSSQNEFTLSDSSGWFDYVALDELWDRKVPPALPDQAPALKAAEAALAAIELRCSDANPDWPAALHGISLLPPVNMIRRAGLHVVPRPDGSAWDHWLYRGEPQLLLDGGAKTRAGVLGAQIEVCIGHLGKVVSIRSRWRPLSGERILADVTPLSASALAPEGGERDDTPASILNFLLEGDDIPQYYLAPYYFVAQGDDIITISASSYSLTVDVGRFSQSSEKVTLIALAQGGSGDYLYNWAVHSPVDLTLGIREIGPGRSAIMDTIAGKAAASLIDLDNGLYVVLLNVKDRRTGAFKHHRQMVFSSPFQGGDTPLLLA